MASLHALNRSASSLAIWAGLYVVGAVACFLQLTGIGGYSRRAIVTGLACTFCTATGVYLLDRVKVANRLLDPADASAHPSRYAFITRRPLAIRLLALSLLAAGMVTGEQLVRWGWTIPLLAAIGVMLYAGRPRGIRPRPKDLVILKNLYVGLGITGFAAIITLAVHEPQANIVTYAQTLRHTPWVFLLAGVHLLLRVIADAMLCDLDDEPADRAFSTATLPTRIGPRPTWAVALTFRLALAALLVLAAPLPLLMRCLWAIVTIASTVALRMLQPARVRDWVDIRLPIEAVAVELATWLLG